MPCPVSCFRFVTARVRREIRFTGLKICVKALTQSALELEVVGCTGASPHSLRVSTSLLFRHSNDVLSKRFIEAAAESRKSNGRYLMKRISRVASE